MTNNREKAKASGWKPVLEVEKIPDHIRDWAYQLWAYKCARDSRRVVAYMKVGEYDGEEELFPPTKVSDRTIRAWAQRYNWAERQLKEGKALHSDIFNAVAAQNINTSVDAVRIRAEMTRMLKEDVEAIATWKPDPENGNKTPPTLRLGAREIKAIDDFTSGILDRAGHTPWTKKDIGEQPVGPSVTHRDAIGGKSFDELISLAQTKIVELASSNPSTPNAHDRGTSLVTDDSSPIEVAPYAHERSADRGAS